MTTTQTRPDSQPARTPPPDPDTVNALLNAFVGDLGATMHAGNAVVGHYLGLYRALAQGPATPAELARRANAHPRYIAEWLRGQAAGGYVTVVDPDAEVYSLSPEQAFVLTDPDGAVYLPGAFLLAVGALKADDRICDAFRTGSGLAWHEHDDEVFTGCEAFFRPGYLANLTTSWLPALDGAVAKLEAGAKVADIGCGLGASSVLIGKSYPATRVHGSDYHEVSIETARNRAVEAGLADRVEFEAAAADEFSGEDYDLATTFDALHDMGDPLAAARHVRETLAPDGTWMIVEPVAGNSWSDNLNPVGRAYYGFSSFLCVPNAISQGATDALGAQAGEAAIRRIVTDAGFTRFARVAQTPFNNVFAARP